MGWFAKIKVGTDGLMFWHQQGEVVRWEDVVCVKKANKISRINQVGNGIKARQLPTILFEYRFYIFIFGQ